MRYHEITHSDRRTERVAPTDKAVAEYRSTGQLSDMRGQETDLVDRVKLILRVNPNAHYLGDPAQPVLLDAAHMLVEAARVSTVRADRIGYRTTAYKMLKSIENDSETPWSVKLDALMVQSDLEFVGLYEDLEAEVITPDQFSSGWIKAHRASLGSFQRTRSTLENVHDKDWKFGRLFEWFFINGKRHQQFRDGLISDRYVRSSFLREDRASNADGIYVHLEDENFDIATEELGENGWTVIRGVQLSQQSKPYKTHPRIQRYVYNPDGLPVPESLVLMREWTKDAIREIEAIHNPRLELTSREQSLMSRVGIALENSGTNLADLISR